MRMYRPMKTPDPAEGWKRIGRINADDGYAFDVWVMRYADGPTAADWRTVRVIAVNPAPHKASYWYATHKGGSLAFARDLAIMRKNRPHMHDVVKQLVAGWAWE